MNKYQEALNKLIEFEYNPMFDCREEYLGLLGILEELVDRATPKKVYYERGELCCKACGEPADYDNAYCGYCGQKWDD